MGFAFRIRLLFSHWRLKFKLPLTPAVWIGLKMVSGVVTRHYPPIRYSSYSLGTLGCASLEFQDGAAWVVLSHGGSHSSRMKLWMRTAKRRQVVAFKTFLRTLLHEVCHHLDYECLKLKDSFHTEGFCGVNPAWCSKSCRQLFRSLIPGVPRPTSTRCRLPKRSEAGPAGPFLDFDRAPVRFHRISIPSRTYSCRDGLQEREAATLLFKTSSRAAAKS